MCTSVNRAAFTAAVLMGLLAGGCAVGPDFVRPSPPMAEQYSTQPGPSRFEADDMAQSVEMGRATDPRWWRLFKSPALDDLVAEGLANSPTLAAARAALTQGQEQARAGAGVFFPSLGVSADATRERSAPALLGGRGSASTLSLYTLTGSVSYALDLFGGERRTVEALNAQAEYQRQAMGAAQLLLTGNIVNAAISRAGYAADVETLADIVALDSAQRDVLTAEAKAGHGAVSAVLLAEQQLGADQASLAQARQRLAASEGLLRTLMGREPATGAPPMPALDDLVVPADAPVSLPSQLVRQRPDILGAEAAMHEASAQVGVATASLFPAITLTGDYGAASGSLARLASPAGRFWSVGPSIDVPVFRGGALWHGRKAAQARYLQAASDYRATVLAALEQVADQLKALDADAAISAASRGAADAATANRALAAANRQAGLIAAFDAMTVDIQADRARLGLIAARAQRLQDVVGLYVACGGGWTGGGEGGQAASAP